MKPTKENLETLKKMGFTCDFEYTGNEKDKEWYSLDNGWGFRIDAHKSIKTLAKHMLMFIPDGYAQEKQ